nr:hypothetical protein [Fredinandcohnia onubensis]
MGTISAPYPLAVAILMGIIAAVVIFVFGALKITGPSAIFCISFCHDNGYANQYR